MKNIVNNYSSIEQLTNQYLNKQKSTDKKINGISFEEILKQQTQPVKFSKHASMRLTQRNINLSDDQSMRLQKGIAAADSKGVNDSLVLVDDIAFIVNVPSKTVVTALYSAVSGLKTHQTRMDVIGNNIANVNTEAFKASSVRFSEIMYQTTSGASAGNGATGTGGKNAKQIGLGVKSGATAVNITGAGSAETTGNPFDLRLNDKNATNFFVVSDGTNRLFTRAGDFYVDGNGYLCMSSTGYTLQGWQVDAKGNVIKDTVSSLQVMSSATKTSAPEATTKAYVSGVLDKNDAQAADTGRIITIGFFDDLGYNYTAKFGIKKTNTDGTYDVTLKDIVDSKGNSIFDVDKDGNFITSQGPNGQTMYSYKGRAVDPQTIFEDASLVFDQSEGTFTSISSANSPAAKTINLNLSVLNTQDASINGSNFSNIEVDFSKSMNYNNNGTSTIGGMNGDLQGDGKGKALGALTGITVSEDGKIYGSYDNGNTVLLCQIAVAQFANASGLEKIGDDCYQSTLNSGEFDGIGVEISADGGSISSGELEMSNVDLSSQFTDMIVTQRGFQANSRVITTSDTLLEELINLKR